MLVEITVAWSGWEVVGRCLSFMMTKCASIGFECEYDQCGSIHFEDDGPNNL